MQRRRKEPTRERTKRLQKEILRQLREPRPLKVRSGGGEIKPGGTLKVGTVQSPSVVGFTPEITNNSFIQYLRCAYESLLYYDEAGNIVGQLASEWEADADTATLTFKLVDGVNFADGTPFNAEAVKWNIEKYIETGRSD